MIRQKFLTICVAATCLAGSLGCQQQQAPLTIRYKVPSEYEIPEDVRRIAISQFAAQASADKGLAMLVSDELAATLAANGYEMVDRTEFSATVFSGKKSMRRKMFAGGAILSGSVKAWKQEKNVDCNCPEIRAQLRKRAFVSVSLTLQDVQDGGTLLAMTLNRDFSSLRSQQQGKGAGQLGKMSDEEAYASLALECVQAFADKTTPRTLSATETLQPGQGSIVRNGNRLANQGRYAEALLKYLAALKKAPNDAGAAFNAGFMCEALGDLDTAEKYYSRAYNRAGHVGYLAARKRVRDNSP